MMVLGLALGLSAFGSIGALIAYKTVWQPRRRRKMERNHARSKLS